MALIALLCVQQGHTQEEPPANRQTISQIPQISVVDKLLSIEMSLSRSLHRSNEEDWAADYAELYRTFHRDGRLEAVTGCGDDQVMEAVALGIKASDAIVALKARNVESLNESANQVEVLARKLGATDADVGMANSVRRFAEDRQWFDAFMALGRLQRNVLARLREEKDKVPLASLVIIGGWIQGGRCVTSVIDKSYNDDVSNILREGRLVEMMQTILQKELPPEKLNHPYVQKLLGLLPEIRKRVNVGFTEPVPQEAVKWLHTTFDGLVREVLPSPK